MYKLIIFIIFKFAFSEIIKIPFGIINTEKESETYPLISKLIYNRLYINITVGTPPQNLKIYLRKDDYALFLHESNFNKTISNSLQSTERLETYFLDIYITGYASKDIIRIGNYNNNDKKLDFIITVSDDNSLGALGLKIPNRNSRDITSFIDSLKNNNIISSSTWTLKYYSNKKLIESINDINNPIGELIIGGEPDEYEENKSIYSNNNYYFLRAPEHDNHKFYWNLIIKSIYIYSASNEKVQIINNNYWKDEVNLKAEYSFILGTKTYYDIIKAQFFNNYKTICEEIIITHKTNWKYIECINDDKLFDIKKFPSIYFDSFEFNKTFELTYEDLFVLDEKSNKYIFLVVFSSTYAETAWSLGIPFLRKYQFTYNEDKKVIGFYNTKDTNGNNDNNNDIDNGNQNKNNKVGLYVFVAVLALIFCVLLIFLGMLIHKWLYGQKRRKKANELDDEYDYEKKESINSKNDKNNENDENINTLIN